MMHVRDASGRRVSLLNDEDHQQDRIQHSRRPLVHHSLSHGSVQSYATSRSDSSSPNTPELHRSDSYDSQMSNSDAMSPMTPNVDYTYPRPSLYAISQHEYPDSSAKRPSYASSARADSYDDEGMSSPLPDRPGKRYPCRYRDSHGCEKTFTTSGHASRHSKIHTAEKAVQCTFLGCQKKFTRADNMKQHLETHFKDKSRSAAITRPHRPSVMSESRRHSTHSTSGRSRPSPRDSAPWDTEQLPLPTPPLLSPSCSARGGAWDMRGPLSGLPILNRPLPSRTPSSGLDALAMAVACQESVAA